LLLGQDLADGEEIKNLSNRYYSYIPHAFGRNRPPVINEAQRLKKEIDLLESLSDMRIAEEIIKSSNVINDGAEQVNPIDRQFRGLGMSEMTPVQTNTTEYKEIESYLCQSVGATHGTSYKVEDIFRIQRDGEFERFDESEFGKLTKSNRRLLWHGSRATNFGGILSQGLRIAPPEAPVSGYMFGKGIYLADMSSKSANYCCPHGSGGVGILLLCETELGDPMLELVNADYDAGEKCRQSQKVATWGKGRTTPVKWKDASSIHRSLKGVSMVSLHNNPMSGGGRY